MPGVASRAKRHRLPSPSAARTTSAARPALSLVDFVGRTWVTRPRPDADGLSSAWFIRRFIDPGARILCGRTADAPGALPFDTEDGAGFGREDGDCTFEVMARRFAIDDPAVRAIGQLVHDVALKDQRYRAPHGDTLDLLIQGLRDSLHDDAVLLTHGIALFEAFYQRLRRPQPDAAPESRPTPRPRKARS